MTGDGFAVSEQDRITIESVYDRMAPGYSPIQAVWVLRTARRNPGVPVAFDERGGGRLAVYWDEQTAAYWPTRQPAELSEHVR